MPEITPLATLSPPSTTRTWLSSPHPTLPLLATACSDKTVKIYSSTSFTQLSTVSGGHKRSIRSVAWKPGSGPGGPGKEGIGESVSATGSFDASAGIWRRWEGTSGLSSGADKDGDGDGDGEERQEVDFTRQGQEEDEDEEWRFAVISDGHDSEIKSSAFSPVSPLLATCSRDKSVWIWEESEDDNFETVAVLQEHEGDVKCVAWHPDEELLASASYDDTIRLWREDIDDWACCARIDGHEGTVWWVEFEGKQRAGLATQQGDSNEEQKASSQEREKAGPRSSSSSDDLSIRIWRRIPNERQQAQVGKPKIPSIIKSNSIEEDWFEEARLPRAHERAVYAVSWSKVTGRIVSTGSDGKIVIYEERWKVARTDPNGDANMENGNTGNGSLTEWVVLAEYENAHDVFEINHVCWAKRADKGKRSDDEEVVVSTGDDGEVRVWTIDP